MSALAAVSTEELIAELLARKDRPVFDAGGLRIVQAGRGGRATWRGIDAGLSEGQLRVLLTLAMWPGHAASADDLGRTLWPTWSPGEARMNARAFIWQLRQRLPGLLNDARRGNRFSAMGYRLNLQEDASG